MWRPEGWDATKITKDKIGQVTSFTTWEMLVEAGADAMLEALRKQPSTHQIIYGIPVLPAQSVQGKYFFIPDDEPEKKEIPFPLYNIKYVKNRDYDCFDRGWYNVGDYWYNVPPMKIKVIESGYFCPIEFRQIPYDGRINQLR